MAVTQNKFVDWKLLDELDNQDLINFLTTEKKQQII